MAGGQFGGSFGQFRRYFAMLLASCHFVEPYPGKY